MLVKPKMRTVRQLHVLSGDLALHKRTLEPIKTLVYGLRRYDVDRCAALVSSAGAGAGADADAQKVEGFMSPKAKVYLADVLDHVDYILNSMDMFCGIAENLINFTFNLASYDMGEVMRRLMLATIIFLPLTLLTGYFGMNFEMGGFWAVRHSDFFFWKVAIPVMFFVITIFCWTDLERVVHFCKKKWRARKVNLLVRRGTINGTGR